ncbi:MAG: hypothetical protein ABJB74_15375 [Gemmatimonas sp.]
MSLERLPLVRKTGDEALHADGRTVGGSLLEFWRWSASDLMSNATRGVLAEYIVHRAIDGADDAIRQEWDAFDLITHDGIRLEVKSAAFIQSWHQRRESAIRFRIPKTKAWSADNNKHEPLSKRQADVYVFALLHERDAPDPLNVQHWTFYVMAARVLDARSRSQHSITLASLEREAQAVATFETLLGAIGAVARTI